MGKKKGKGSTIKIEPQVKWPKLGDDGPGGKEIEQFYERFEEIAAIAKDGEGMNDREMLMTLKMRLHNSKQKIYENEFSEHQHLMETERIHFLSIRRLRTVA